MRAVIPVQTRTGYGRSFERRILRHTLAGRLLRPGEAVLVAVSGGPDSTTLLTVLYHLAEKLRINLGVGHLDHALQPGSAEEAQQVRALVEAAGIPVWSERRETPAFPLTRSDCGEDPVARSGEQPSEETLRIARYDFLARTAKQEGFTVIASGHHADDQAETVLLRLVRGAGGRGLRAMSPRTSFPSVGYRDLTIVRPLLETTRAEIELYCEREELPVLRDPSNDSLDFTRNRIRHEVLPLLSSLNPAASSALGRAARSLARDEDYLAARANEVLAEAATCSDRGREMDRNRLLAEHPAVQIRVLRQAAQELGVLLHAEESEKLLDLVAKGRGHLDLSAGVAVVVSGNTVTCGDLSGLDRDDNA